MCCHFKSVNGLDKQSGFSIAPVVQYCSVARERVKLNCLGIQSPSTPTQPPVISHPLPSISQVCVCACVLCTVCVCIVYDVCVVVLAIVQINCLFVLTTESIYRVTMSAIICLTINQSGLCSVSCGLNYCDMQILPHKYYLQRYYTLSSQKKKTHFH